jgi:chromosome segregation ATPase
MFETLLEINWGSLKSAKNITDDLNLKLKNAQHQIKTQEVEIAELKSKCIELEQYITGLAYCVKDIEDHINKTFSTDIRFINPFGGAIPEA